MSEREIALQLTLKTLELDLIPHTKLDSSSSTEDIDKVSDFNAGQILHFFKKLRSGLQ